MRRRLVRGARGSPGEHACPQSWQPEIALGLPPPPHALSQVPGPAAQLTSIGLTSQSWPPKLTAVVGRQTPSVELTARLDRMTPQVLTPRVYHQSS